MQKGKNNRALNGKYTVELAAISKIDEPIYKYEGLIMTQSDGINRTYGASEIKIKAQNISMLREQMQCIIEGIVPECKVDILDLTERR